MEGDDLFKKEFKRFRKKNPKPDFRNVIDFDNIELHTDVESIPLNQLNAAVNSNLNHDNCKACETLGLNNHSKWNVYSIQGKDGLYFVKNAFSKCGQQNWIKKFLEVYPRKPNVTNLDAHFENVDDIWTLQWSPEPEKNQYLSKLRWATLGYHHNWETKVYSQNNCCEFPSCLEALSQHTASSLGFQTFKPEAAIINYYQLDSSIGGHIDYSELDHTAPILSFSFGQTGVFLLGTQNKCDKPVAMFIRSGDIVVMSGNCRLSYHAVPLVVKDNTTERYEESVESCMWQPFAEYLRSSRINANVRQVFPTPNS